MPFILVTCLFSLWGFANDITNPMVAALYPEEKTHRLNILHAWWPAGIVVGGLLGVAITGMGLPWELNMLVLMMPALALEMARRNHDFVLGDAKKGLAEELRGMGAKVEVVPDTADQTKDDTIQKLVDRAIKVYGSFDSACIRTGTHGTGTIMDTTNEDCRLQYEGNFRSVWYALKALMPPLMKQGSGQIVINTSAAGARVQEWFALYGATRAGANELVHAAGLEAAPHGVTVNATGTYAMNYESFIHDIGGDTDPAKLTAVTDQIPIRRLVEPEDAAYFVAGLIDGKNTAMTAQFIPIDGGWSFM